MNLVTESRLSDSPYVDLITHGYSTGDDSVIRPAETNWHMVIVTHEGETRLLVVGPLTTSGIAFWRGEADVLWIKFRLGTFLPHLSTRQFLDRETRLPGASSQSFWLKGSALQFPDYENADTFVEKLVHNELLVCDPVVSDVLRGHPHSLSPRTVRHRFLQTTGLSQNHIHQFERAKRAEWLLLQGVSILDTVYETGYFDQPHLTRSLKQFIGYTPAQIVETSRIANLYKTPTPDPAMIQTF